jgi:hypothetical protein
MILSFFLFFVNPHTIIFTQNSGQIAHNVPAVCDGLAARIRALRSKDQGRQTVGGVSRGKERSD